MVHYTRRVKFFLGQKASKKSLDDLRRNMRELGGWHIDGGYDSLVQEFEFNEPVDSGLREGIVECAFVDVKFGKCEWSDSIRHDKKGKEE
jgi:hypothetical protein